MNIITIHMTPKHLQKDFIYHLTTKETCKRIVGAKEVSEHIFWTAEREVESSTVWTEIVTGEPLVSRQAFFTILVVHVTLPGCEER